MNPLVLIVYSVFAILLIWLRGALKAQNDMDDGETVSIDDPEFKNLEPEEALRRYSKRRVRLAILWPYYFLVVAKRRRKPETRTS